MAGSGGGHGFGGSEGSRFCCAGGFLAPLPPPHERRNTTHDRTTTAGRRRRWRMTSMALLAAMALVMAACGGHDAEEATGGWPTGRERQHRAVSPSRSWSRLRSTVRSAVPEHPRDRTVRTPSGSTPRAASRAARWRSWSATTRPTPAKLPTAHARLCEEKVVANVGGFTLDVGQAIPIYEQNKIAWFGECCPLRDQEFNSKICFPLGFVNAFPTAAAIRMVDDGCKNIVGVLGDDTAERSQIEAYKNGFKSERQGPAQA